MQTSAPSVVRTHQFSPSLRLRFAPNEKQTYYVSINPVWRRSTGDRADFTTINTWDVNYEARVDLVLPWELKYATSLVATTRYGYSDASLNTTRWLWNMSLSRSFKHGFSLSLEANDILGDNHTISANIDAQGRTEYYRRMLPSYVLATVRWTFNRVGGKKK